MDRKIIYATVFLLMLATATAPVFSQLKLPRLVSDSMILQRDASINIWGWAKAGESVTIRFKGSSYTTRSDSGGKWIIKLPPQKAGGPYDMEITASSRIVLKDLLVGDVWVCSGQSNMELPMERLKDKYPEIIARAGNDQIRQFNVSTAYHFQSAQEDYSSGSWETATPQSVLHFTAVGYFFAKALFERYHVPVGLIKSAVGGAPVEAWLSEEALKAFPDLLALAEKNKNQHYVDSILAADRASSKKWYDLIREKDRGLQERIKWFDTAYDAGSWATMPVPGNWEEAGLPHTNGVVWFRKELDLPSEFTGKPVRLFLGNIVDRDSVYVNGLFVGTTGYQYPPRKYPVPAGIFKAGKNVITVRVINYTGVGGFYKGKSYQIRSGQDTFDLKGEWKFRLGATADPIPPTTTFQYQPEGLFNAMIAPMLPMTVKGVIWYQGESNASRAKEYQKLFPSLITDWRQKWKRTDLPFLYVQLANFMPAVSQPGESGWAELREAQFKTLAMPQVAMVVTTDIGEWNDIHPQDKEDVGKRLALAAEKMAYGEKHLVYSGPLYQSYEKKGNKIIIRFTQTGSGLMAKGSGGLKGFAIAAADKHFVWAKAIIQKNRLIVWSDAIRDPVAVRYAWADNPEEANLYNREGLPASPFRTDDQ